MHAMQHADDATCTRCNMHTMQHADDATCRRCNMQTMQHADDAPYIAVVLYNGLPYP